MLSLIIIRVIAIQFPFLLTKIGLPIFILGYHLIYDYRIYWFTTERIKVKAYKNFFKTGGD